MRKFNQPLDDQVEADMTPMLDIVFIMLIFFIVTTSFVKESGININRPQQSDTTIDNAIPAIQLKIDQNDVITLDDREIDFRAVGANIERQKAENPDASVIIVVDPSSTTNIMIKVVDAARKAGIELVNVANSK